MKYKILFILFVSTILSCDNFIDIEPTDIITDDIALETIQDFEQAVIGIYSGVVGGAYYGGTYITTADWMSDDFRRSSENLGQGVQMHSFIFDAGTGEPNALWTQLYSVINRANLVITKIDAIEGDEKLKKSLKGQALFMRGMAHFDLVRYFSKNYSATPDASHFGVPILLESKISEPTRNTIAEVYAQVVTDLVDARQLMSESEINGGNIKATPLAATALLARVALYMEDWASARDFASEVIAAPGLSLATTTNYQNMWTSLEVSGEIIFKLDMVVGNATIGGNYWGENNDIVFFNPTQDLIDLYDADDARQIFFGIRKPSDPDNVLTKYRGAPLGSPLTTVPPTPGLADIKLLRLSEMYLIRSEANFELNNEPAALADLNSVRSARETVFVPGAETGNALESAILNERRKEFVAEGHRWFDLKRKGLDIVRGADCSATTCELNSDNFRFTLPIPQAEIFANPNIEPQQNEGY